MHATRYRKRTRARLEDADADAQRSVDPQAPPSSSTSPSEIDRARVELASTHDGANASAQTGHVEREFEFDPECGPVLVPADVLLVIAEFLPMRTLVSMSTCCTELRRLLVDSPDALRRVWQPALRENTCIATRGCACSV